MLKSNKGFMLVEVVIVATVVLTTMIFLYTSINKLYNNYKVRNSYYNIDAMYATKEIINTMMKKDGDSNINNFINANLSNISNYSYIIEDNCDTSILESCRYYKDNYNINNLILAKYNKIALDELKDVVNNQTFKDYIDYVLTYYDVDNNDYEYDYIVLIEVIDNDNYYYANMRVR